MATRMQQRRGTAAQWTAANPTLAAGEIGFETDTNKFKMGNGTNAWSTLVYFTNNTALETLLAGDYPATLDTLNEIAAALGDDPTFFTTVATNLSTHAADTTSVHGIDNTALLATTAGVAAAISGHDQATTGVHGINNTALLAIASEVADDISAAVTAHNDDTLLVHGIANTAELVTTAILTDALTDATVDQSSLAGAGLTWDAAVDQFIVDLTVMATKQYSDTALSTHQSDTSNVHGIPDTTSLATQTNVSDAITAQAAITTTEIGTHNSDTTSVHGIADTAALATKTYADDAVSTHNSDTTNVHGIADTSALATTSATATAIGTAVSDHNSDTTNVHGIADTALLATTAYADQAETDAIAAAGTAADTKISTAVAALTKSSVGLGNVDNTSDADKPVSDDTQDALDLKAPLAGPSFTGDANFEGNVTIEGNLTVEGTTTTVNTSEVQINDPLFYLAANQYDANTRDIGITGAYGTVGGTEANHLHTGLVKDVTDGKWKLFSNAPHPVNNVVDFTSAAYDTLKVGSLEATTVTPSSGVVFSDGTQTKEGVPSRTPIVQKTASYALSALTHRDSLIEVSSTDATTITIPLDSTVDYPIGTTIDILQTNTGQVTIAPVSGSVTVNATPGLKLRTRWSSATLMKRAANTWVVYGDLTA